MESLCQLVEQIDDPLQANKALNSIARLAEINHPILQSEIQLLPRLLHLSSKLTLTLQIKANALCVMRNLSRHASNKQEMFRFPGLVDLLVDTLDNGNRCGETSLKAFPLAILSNLACDRQVRGELFANSALLGITVRLAQAHKELKPIALQFIANMAIDNGGMLLVCPDLIELLYSNRRNLQCLRALGLLRFHKLPPSEVPSTFNSRDILLFWRCVRIVWVVRSACEVKRIGTRSTALNRLPKELCRMVFMNLHG